MVQTVRMLFDCLKELALIVERQYVKYAKARVPSSLIEHLRFARKLFDAYCTLMRAPLVNETVAHSSQHTLTEKAINQYRSVIKRIDPTNEVRRFVHSFNTASSLGCHQLSMLIICSCAVSCAVMYCV